MIKNGEWFDSRPGEHCMIRVSAAETNGAYSVVEIVSDHLDGTPLHVHQNEDECVFVLEGAGRVAYGEEIFDVVPGSSMMLKRGVPHAWCNPHTSPLRMLFISTPGGCEEALRIIAEVDEVHLQALAERFHIKMVGPGILESLSPSSAAR